MQRLWIVFDYCINHKRMCNISLTEECFFLILCFKMLWIEGEKKTNYKHMFLCKRNNSFAVRFGHLFTFKMIIKQNSQRLIAQRMAFQTKIRRRHMCWMHMLAFFVCMAPIKMRLRNNKKYHVTQIKAFDFFSSLCRMRAENYTWKHEVFFE